MSGRQCGDCQLCCTLLPVEELEKPALQRCRHQKHGKGCAIYGKHPLSCAVWNCRWLVDDPGFDLSRPDHGHYVVDILPDVVSVANPGEQPRELQVLVVWLDPRYPLAYRDRGLRAFIERAAMPALIRVGSLDAFALFPPSITGGQGWIETDSKRADASFKGFAQRIREATRGPQLPA